MTVFNGFWRWVGHQIAQHGGVPLNAHDQVQLHNLMRERDRLAAADITQCETILKGILASLSTINEKREPPDADHAMLHGNW